jgi:hypothetical protein
MLKKRIINLLRKADGLSDREITNRLICKETRQQPINQACRKLMAEGSLLRIKK